MADPPEVIRITGASERRPSLWARLTGSNWFMAIASPVLMLLLWEAASRAGLFCFQSALFMW